jgi:hypothetical protein
MAKMTEKELLAWEKTRNLGEEILQGIQAIKKGKTGRRFTKNSFPLVRAREKAGLSQA